jgi:putative peptidoglycan lipid II flippase
MRELMMREFGVAEASVIIAASFFISAVLGAVRQILLNAQFGAGDTVSAYYAAAKLPDTLFTLIAGGALWTAMIPVLTDMRRTGGAAAERRLADIVLTAVMATAIVIVLLGEITAPFFVSNLLVPGFDDPTTDLTTRLTRLLLIHPLIIATASVAMAVLNARSRFLLPAIAIAIHNLAEIAGIVSSWAIPSLGIYGPVAGVIAGALLQAAVLFAALWPADWRPRFRWKPHDPGLRAVLYLLIPTSLSLGVGYLGGVLDAAFASRAPEEAALPAIVNAYLLVALPVRLIGFASGQAAFPRLVTAASEPGGRHFRRLTNRVSGAALLLSIPATVGLIVLARPTVWILFEHGEFDANAGSLTAKLIVLYAIGLPAYALTEVLTRSLVALRDTRTPLVTNLLQFALRAAIAFAFLGSLGVEVIPVGFAVSSFVEVALLAIVLRRRSGMLGRPGSLQ